MSFYAFAVIQISKKLLRTRLDFLVDVMEEEKIECTIDIGCKGLFIQNATEIAALQRSRRNGLNKTN